MHIPPFGPLFSIKCLVVLRLILNNLTASMRSLRCGAILQHDSFLLSATGVLDSVLVQPQFYYDESIGFDVSTTNAVV